MEINDTESGRWLGVIGMKQKERPAASRVTTSLTKMNIMVIELSKTGTDIS